MSRRYTTKVKCYDCQAQVYNLKEHRTSCPKSRKNRSRVDASPKSKKVKKNTRDYYLLLDVSGSMIGTRLANAKEGARQVVAHEMAENDRMAIVTFDTHAYFKLKPRPVGQILRQQELEPLLDRIFAEGGTAIWDAIYMSLEQMRDPDKETKMVVLTDGDDNSSRHTFAQCLELLEARPNTILSVVHVENTPSEQYRTIAERGRGTYHLIKETEIVTTIRETIKYVI